jgi:sugar phosphate isomerase/epimerase
MHGEMSRRTLLKAAGAAGAGLALAGVPSVALAARDYAGLPMGIQSYSLRGYPFEVAIQKINAMGLKHAEFFGAHFPMNSKPEDVKARLDKLKSLNIAPNAYGVEGFGKDHDANRRKFEFAKSIGLKNLTADTPNPRKSPADLKVCMESLSKLVDEYGINIAIHNHGPTHHYSRPEDVLDAVKDAHKRVGACADLGHYIRSACDPVEVLEKLKDRLYGIHLKDFLEPKGNARGCILGKGVMKVDKVMKWLIAHKFDGALSLEYEENPKNPDADIEACLEAAAAGCK